MHSNEVETITNFFRNSCTSEELEKVKKWISEGKHSKEFEVAMKEYENDFQKTTPALTSAKIFKSMFLKIQKKISSI